MSEEAKYTKTTQHQGGTEAPAGESRISSARKEAKNPHSAEWSQRKKDIGEKVNEIVRSGFVVSLSGRKTRSIEEIVDGLVFKNDDNTDITETLNADEKFARLRAQVAEEIIDSRVSIEGKSMDGWRLLLSEMLRQEIEIPESEADDVVRCLLWRIDNAHSHFLLDVLGGEVQRLRLPLDQRSVSEEQERLSQMKRILLDRIKNCRSTVQKRMKDFEKGISQSDPSLAAAVHASRMKMSNTSGVEGKNEKSAAEGEIVQGQLIFNAGDARGWYRVTEVREGWVQCALVPHNPNYRGGIQVEQKFFTKNQGERYRVVSLEDAETYAALIGILRSGVYGDIPSDFERVEWLMNGLVSTTRQWLRHLEEWDDAYAHDTDWVIELAQGYIENVLRSHQIVDTAMKSIVRSICMRVSQER